MNLKHFKGFYVKFITFYISTSAEKVQTLYRYIMAAPILLHHSQKTLWNVTEVKTFEPKAQILPITLRQFIY